MKRLTSTMLFLIGLILFSYPSLIEKYNDYRQEKILDEFKQEVMLEMNPDYQDSQLQPALKPPLYPTESLQDLKSECLELKKLALIKEKRLRTDQKRLQEEARIRREQQRKEYIASISECIIEIPKINLEMPVLNDATPKNLNISPSKVRGSSQLGNTGNYSIAGHRSKRYGRHFNRLDELGPGDRVSLHTKEKDYVYEIKEKLLVTPQETWVLDSNKNESELTLITCHPIDNPTHRLVVKGTLVESN